MNHHSQFSHQHGQEPQILEGEVVGAPRLSAEARRAKEEKEKEKKQHHHQTSARFSVFQIPIFAKLRRNCLLSLLGFATFAILAAYFQNAWFFVLAVLLPPWIFSSKKF